MTFKSYIHCAGSLSCHPRPGWHNWGTEVPSAALQGGWLDHPWVPQLPPPHTRHAGCWGRCSCQRSAHCECQGWKVESGEWGGSLLARLQQRQRKGVYLYQQRQSSNNHHIFSNIIRHEKIGFIIDVVHKLFFYFCCPNLYSFYTIYLKVTCICWYQNSYCLNEPNGIKLIWCYVHVLDWHQC